MDNLPTTVYTPESPLRRPLLLIRQMFTDLVASRELAWRLFLRDLSAQYRQSILGYFWAFVPPLVASLPFVFLNSQGVIRIQNTSIPYGAFAVISTIIWQVFLDALNSPLRTVLAAKVMLIRLNFPREAILLSGLAMVLFNSIVRFLLLAAVLGWYSIVPPVTALLFPVGVLGLILLGFTIGLAITPIGLLYADFQQTLPVFSTFLLFATPVLYPMPLAGPAATLAHWNPLAPQVVATRDWLTTGSTAGNSAFFVVFFCSLAALFGCWILFRLALPHLVARLGN